MPILWPLGDWMMSRLACYVPSAALLLALEASLHRLPRAVATRRIAPRCPRAHADSIPLMIGE